MSRLLALVATAALVGCTGGTELAGKADTIDELIAKARDNGAQRCAPVELAMAESHNDFGKQELSEGNYYQAKDELSVAENNVREAIRKSPKNLCNPEKKVRVAQPKPKPKPTDRDGDGILDPDDDCPDDPEDKDGFEDDDGCPDNDNDNDGLADKVDDCPDDPEDKDGFEDDDGCPDCDNDGDGVLECPQVVDKCPDQPAQTPDGCPKKYKLVVVTKTKIELKQTIFFETAKAKIKRVSFPLLNEVAQALADNPKIRVRIEGHTDSRGSDRYNERLSDSRAKSVRDYLIGRGIDGDRMVAKGYGESRPIASNRTKAGRAQNRRVEFVIIDK